MLPVPSSTTAARDLTSSARPRSLTQPLADARNQRINRPNTIQRSSASHLRNQIEPSDSIALSNADDLDHNIESEQGQNGGEDNNEVCIICMRRDKKNNPLTSLPCANNPMCRNNLVHLPCIFEWKEQHRPDNTHSNNCPLCRGELAHINYSPPDLLHSVDVGRDKLARKLFILSPIPKDAGMIRCYLKVKNNPFWGSPYLYEFYLQKPSIKKYPHGCLPDNKSPKAGDIFLLGAKKRYPQVNLSHTVSSFFGLSSIFGSSQSQVHSSVNNDTSAVEGESPNSVQLNVGTPGFQHTAAQNYWRSCIDISLSHVDFDKAGEEYVGSVEASSFTGLEYTTTTSIYHKTTTSTTRKVPTASENDADYHSAKSHSNAGSLSVVQELDEGQTSELDQNGSSSIGTYRSSRPSYTSAILSGLNIFGSTWRRRVAVTTNAILSSGKNNGSNSIVLNDFVKRTVEIGAVHYTQNRVGAESGPRKMRVCFPKVELGHRESIGQALVGSKFSLKPETLVDPASTSTLVVDAEPLAEVDVNDKKAILSDDEDEDDPQEDYILDPNSVNCFITQFYEPEHPRDTMNKLMRKKKQMESEDPRSGNADPSSGMFMFGKNKEPYWLDRIQAYSLDFSGRVTLPSNKNFQIEMEDAAARNPRRQSLSPGDNEGILLQFGKVVSSQQVQENISVYTVDFRFPLSPLQALGICLSSCDRKFACA